MRVAVLTISDAGARGERADSSGDAIVAWAAERGYTLAGRTLVADDSVAIVRQLLAWCDGDAADLVLTTGGTGLSPRDFITKGMGSSQPVASGDDPDAMAKNRRVEIWFELRGL